MTPKVRRNRTAVIKPADIQALISRLNELDTAIARHLLHAKHCQVDLKEAANMVLYDVRKAVVEAWAQRLFPGRFHGMTTADAGRFDWKSFELFRENDLIDDIVCEGDFDKTVAAEDRKRVEAFSKNILEIYRTPAFRAVRNPVTTVMQFDSGWYSHEAQTLHWFKNLADESVMAYGVFAEIIPDVSCKDASVRFVPLGVEDPSAEKYPFLGWAFYKGTMKFERLPFGLFGFLYSGIPGLEDASFSENELACSTFEHSIGRKWSATTK